MKNIFYLQAFSLLLIACSHSEKPLAETTAPVAVADTAPIAAVLWTVGPTPLDSIALKLSLALSNESADMFQSIMPDAKDMESIYISMAPPGRAEDAKAYFRQDKVAENEKKFILESFTRAIGRGKELKIDWKNVVPTGLKVDSTEQHGYVNYNGEIAFSENNREFFIKFSDCIRLKKGKLVMTNVATPYEDLSDENLKKNEKYRASYVRRCIKHLNRVRGKGPDIFDPKLSNDEICICSFETIAKQTYGEDNLKDTMSINLQSGKCK